MAAWPDADGRGRCPSSFDVDYAPGRVPPDCLDWTLNPTNAPPRQFKTTSQPLFTLGYNTTISEDWMRQDEGLQYSIKNFTFSTKRTTTPANGDGPVDEYDSLLVSIPQVSDNDRLSAKRRKFLSRTAWAAQRKTAALRCFSYLLSSLWSVGR